MSAKGLALAALLAAASLEAQPTFTLLRSNSNGGALPASRLVTDGTYMYGTTLGVGGGMVFRFDPSDPGGTMRVLHTFTGGANDGYSPAGDLVHAGGDLYGTTTKGGSWNLGTVFKLPGAATASPGAIVLVHHFAGRPLDGANPRGGVIWDGGVLYGTTAAGGSNDDGTIYRIPASGSGFELLHSFQWFTPSPLGEGRVPTGSLAVWSGTLYGVTQAGGEGTGTVFKCATDGSSFQTMRAFAGDGSEGSNPQAGLVFDVTTGYLYGTTAEGGDFNLGTLFRIKSTETSPGSGTYAFWKFFDFDSDASEPRSALFLDPAFGGTLYGTTLRGGSPADGGTVFKVSTIGTGFTPMAVFSGPPEGYAPAAGLLLRGSDFWGTTLGGGPLNAGSVFSLPVGGGAPETRYGFRGGEITAPVGLVMDEGGNLYGTDTLGGTSGYGSVFKIKKNGAFLTLHSFGDGESPDGSSPVGELVYVPPTGGATCGTLYGLTSVGGTDFAGTVFKISTDDSGSGFETIHDFKRLNPKEGYEPVALALIGSDLYITNANGGTSSTGAILKLPANAARGSNAEFVFEFGSSSTDPSSPNSRVVPDAAGNLFGTTKLGGANGLGAVYKLTVGAPTPFTNLHSFGTPLLLPVGAPVLDGDFLYGVLNSLTSAPVPGAAYGVLYKVQVSSKTFQVIHEFSGKPGDGAYPTGSLALGGSAGARTLLGTTARGGPADAGTVFLLPAPATTPPVPPPVLLLHSFDYGPQDAVSPTSQLLLDASGNLFGTTMAGGEYSAGILYKLSTPGGFGTGIGGTGTGDGNCSSGCTPPDTPTATSNSPVCDGSTIQLSTPTVPGATYWWTGPGFTSSEREPTRSATGHAGDYQVTITVNGCTSAPGTISVIVNPRPATPTANGGGHYCTGETIQLSTLPVAGATYAWSGPNNFVSNAQNPTRSATAANAGEYLVTLTVDGCTSAAGRATVVVQDCSKTPTPVITTLSEAGAGSPNRVASVVHHPDSTYQWSISNGTIMSGAGTNAITFTAGTQGTLTLSVTEWTLGYAFASDPGTATVTVLSPMSALQYYVVTPCRLLDTREISAEFTSVQMGAPNLEPNQSRTFTASSRCGVPASAKSIVVNVTAVAPTADGLLFLWGDGIPKPSTHLMYLHQGKTRAALTSIALPNGSFWIHNESGGETPVVVDVSGYFE